MRADLRDFLPPRIRFWLKFKREQLRALRRESPQHRYSEADALGERGMTSGQRPLVLVFDERLPTPDRDAGSARMVAILNALTEWSNPLFIPLNTKPWPEGEKRLRNMGVETARIVDYRRLIKQPNV